MMHPKLTTALKIAGGILLAPVVAIGALSLAGFTPGGVAAGDLVFCLHRGGPTLKYNIGSLAAAVQSTVYGGATGGVFSLLQAAGAGAILPFVWKVILAGVCAVALYYFVKIVVVPAVRNLVQWGLKWWRSRRSGVV